MGKMSVVFLNIAVTSPLTKVLEALDWTTIVVQHTIRQGNTKQYPLSKGKEITSNACAKTMKSGTKLSFKVHTELIKP